MATIRSVCLILTATVIFIGCGNLPERTAGPQKAKPTAGKMYSKNLGKGVVRIAENVIGTPYRYGGTTLKGFDCSGLVFYSYKKVGVHVPRTALSLYNNTKRIKKANLYLGDLVFFKLTGSKTSHVGIYAGSDRFIHAPSSGKKVMVSKLGDPYWRKRYVGGGRF